MMFHDTSLITGLRMLPYEGSTIFFLGTSNPLGDAAAARLEVSLFAAAVAAVVGSNGDGVPLLSAVSKVRATGSAGLS